MTPLELLAPARDVETGIAAIDCGADAVYIGAGHHGARAGATNSIADIARLCDYAHRFRARVYVTVNTLVYEDELDDVRSLVGELYRAGVDALIVQDMALLKMDIPPIALHASTQCDTRSPEKASFLQSVGFEQIVLPREMTLDEIRAVRAATDVPLEGFVHGALCVSYSGDCRASLVNGGRSANRGECAQICRLPYTLVDGNGNTLVRDKHLLSLRDMNRMAMLAQMADAGISSFKIEGRLKSADYVRNVVAAYSAALDQVIAANPGRYCRASAGHSDVGFAADVNKAFNRGFTNYFLTDTQPAAHSMASFMTAKHIGEPIAKVRHADRRSITIDTASAFNNGDGIVYFDASGKLTGVRVNNISGNRLLFATDLPAAPTPGTVLYRNFDKSFADKLNAARSRRTIGVKMQLDSTLRGTSLTISDERGCTVTAAADVAQAEARTPQHDVRRRILDRTGDTIYTVTDITDNLGKQFVPSSQLTELRRHALELLDHAAAATYVRSLQKKVADTHAPYPKTHLDMHDNVANSLARAFYAEHGATVTENALELDPKKAADTMQVMTTRYCLRRELGLCLKTPQGRAVKGPLRLLNADGRTRPMRLDFDCKACRMNVIAENKH